ncbi:MAG: DUF5329 family protein, partial [Syntrophorhabdales bacterium]
GAAVRAEVSAMRLKGAAAAVLLLCFLIAFPFASPALPWDVPPAAEPEIRHLLSYIERSGCRFYRNSAWYEDTRAVRDHVESKLNYFMKKGLINSTEDFIRWSASKSETSGEPYMVRCGKGSPLPLAQWLSEELDRYRKENR